ncbi:annexin B9-like isoform X2 [Ischnura elegans]|uniref:annexin B9-like isoform X2 n=1 Tax=Ischnura elegans TaxID=197161 RepID=UPI001ED8ABAC|nr:annexin B9-like isoform X2 [Ischnura elegans]
MSYPYQTNPTIVPAADFNARADAEALRKAMKGLGTDEKAIIQVLAKKSNMQRQEIANQFKALYGKDLIKDLKGELSGRFEDLVLACVTPLPQFYAKELHDAMSGVGTDEACLVEILATSSNHYINVIRSTYKAMYGKDLERELGGETSGHFRRLLVSLCQGRRDENPVVNPGICAEDARALLKAGEKKWGTDESTFNAILATRSFPHLHQLMVDYERLSGHSLEKAIKKEFSGDIEEGLLAIVKSAADRSKFFAERLHKAMAGFGTKDRTLIRIIVTRSEVDLGDIKAEFHRAYGKTLEDFISGDTSGDYKKMLLAMVQ